MAFFSTESKQRFGEFLAFEPGIRAAFANRARSGKTAPVEDGRVPCSWEEWDRATLELRSALWEELHENSAALLVAWGVATVDATRPIVDDSSKLAHARNLIAEPLWCDRWLYDRSGDRLDEILSATLPARFRARYSRLDSQSTAISRLAESLERSDDRRALDQWNDLRRSLYELDEVSTSTEELEAMSGAVFNDGEQRRMADKAHLAPYRFMTNAECLGLLSAIHDYESWPTREGRFIRVSTVGRSESTDFVFPEPMRASYPIPSYLGISRTELLGLLEVHYRHAAEARMRDPTDWYDEDCSQAEAMIFSGRVTVAYNHLIHFVKEPFTADEYRGGVHTLICRINALGPPAGT